MLAFSIRRMIEAWVVMLIVALLAFVLFRYVGNPVDQMAGQYTSLADRELMHKQLGLDDPILVQIARFLWNALHLDFGISYHFREPVSQLLMKRGPATLELSFAASLFAIAVGIPLGVFTGIYKDSLWSKFFLGVSLIGVSLPTFLIGVLLIFAFSVELHWLPSYGRGDTVALGLWQTGFLTASGLRALILPSITLGLFQLTLIARLVRSEMLEVLRTDFIRFARARGLSERAINFNHALKNTLIPVITITGLQIGSIIAFAVITETVFQWPGMGLLFITAVQSADIPVMAAYLILVSLMFVTINFIVDVLYAFVDPRIRLHAMSAT
ncbi:MAG: ABC transporter permease [Hyphomicrobiales bacterium]|nr:ABC transporter permease [Hyphomicrobiales bacterium]